MKDTKATKKNNLTSPTRREMIKIGTITGVASTALLGLGGSRKVIASSLLGGATPVPSEPIILDGGPRWIQVSFPFPVEMDRDGRHYIVYPDDHRPHIERIVITDDNGSEVFNWPVPANWRIAFE